MKVTATEAKNRLGQVLLAQTVRVEVETLHLAAHLSAALPRQALGSSLGSLKSQADVLRDALDAVVSGI